MTSSGQAQGICVQRTAVVGAGVVGLLTAWQLRISGHQVTIIDPAPGSQASYAAAGMLAPISEVQYGQQPLWDLMSASNAEYPALIATLERATEVSTGYRSNGTLLIAADPGDRSAVAELVTVQQTHGMDIHPLTSRQLRARESALAPGLAKAWEVPGDQQVNPRQLVRCVTAALNAELDSAHFPSAAPPARWIPAHATTVEQDGSGDLRVSVAEPDDGAAADHRASQVFDHAVISPGLGYQQIGGIPQAHPLDLRAVYGDVIRLRVRPEQLEAGDEQIVGATIRAKVRGRSVYLVPRAPEDPLEPRGLVVGASSREDGLPGTHAGSVAELLEDATAVLPAVREMELREITSRARPGTPDDMPYLGAVEGSTGVVVSTGYHRHGILLAPLAARLGAALITGAKLSEQDAGLLKLMDLGRSSGDQETP